MLSFFYYFLLVTLFVPLSCIVHADIYWIVLSMSSDPLSFFSPSVHNIMKRPFGGLLLYAMFIYLSCACLFSKNKGLTELFCFLLGLVAL